MVVGHHCLAGEGCPRFALFHHDPPSPSRDIHTNCSLQCVPPIGLSALSSPSLHPKRTPFRLPHTKAGRKPVEWGFAVSLVLAREKYDWELVGLYDEPQTCFFACCGYMCHRAAPSTKTFLNVHPFFSVVSGQEWLLFGNHHHHLLRNLRTKVDPAIQVPSVEQTVLPRPTHGWHQIAIAPNFAWLGSPGWPTVDGFASTRLA
mmetsp:Transcript_10289/g.28380  ORF Transcript_10289/g.28380 Transcript_10289/m.28380 type:complete len:203 (+) Transcript_10289:711-1319(+)